MLSLSIICKFQFFNFYQFFSILVNWISWCKDTGTSQGYSGASCLVNISVSFQRLSKDLSFRTFVVWGTRKEPDTVKILEILGRCRKYVFLGIKLHPKLTPKRKIPLQRRHCRMAMSSASNILPDKFVPLKCALPPWNNPVNNFPIDKFDYYSHIGKLICFHTWISISKKTLKFWSECS